MMRITRTDLRMTLTRRYEARSFARAEERGCSGLEPSQAVDVVLSSNFLFFGIIRPKAPSISQELPAVLDRKTANSKDLLEN